MQSFESEKTKSKTHIISIIRKQSRRTTIGLLQMKINFVLEY